MAKIAILVPTYKRPKLLSECLVSLSEQNTSCEFKIIVSDNDAKLQDGVKICEELKSSFKHGRELLCQVEKAPGLTENRNSGLKLAFSDPDIFAVAMIDDDATADPNWIESINNAIQKNEADIYGGPTQYIPSPGSKPWIDQLEMFQPAFEQDGYVKRLRSANNCIITRTLWEKYDQKPFHDGFSKTGGEDTQLFTDLSAKGLKSYWISRAIVSEIIPPDRCKTEWIKDRHVNGAMNVARANRISDGFLASLKTQLGLAFKESITGFIRILSWDEKTRFVGSLRLFGAIGRIRGMLGGKTMHDTQKDVATDFANK